MSTALDTEFDIITVQDDETMLQRLFDISSQHGHDDSALLLNAMTEQAMQGTLLWDKNLTVSITRAIDAIDDVISRQLATVMHHPALLRLEGSWRGMHHLVHNTETSQGLQIRMFNIAKSEVSRDLARAVEFDQSQLFRSVYENEFGTAGGEPFGVLLGDYEFDASAEDISTLAGLSHIAAAGFAPFISAPSPQMFGLNSFTELSRPRDLEKIFTASEYARWRSFRDSDDARFVSLVLPRVLARMPYGNAGLPVEGFRYEEFAQDAGTHGAGGKHEHFCWMNATYVIGSVLTRAFAEHGWCTQIRGADSGGRSNALPLHSFISDDGDVGQLCPTETGITDRREAELSRLGFLPICHYKNTDYAVFFGAQTVQKPKRYDDAGATANAAISARLPYVMATSRIAHYLKVMARDRVGSFLQAQDTEAWLNHWIGSYCNSNAGASAETKARFPLAEARVEVREVEGAPGSYRAIAYLRPWLQMEELTASLRLVASIPSSRQE